MEVRASGQYVVSSEYATYGGRPSSNYVCSGTLVRETDRLVVTETVRDKLAIPATTFTVPLTSPSLKWPVTWTTETAGAPNGDLVSLQVVLEK